MASLNDREFPRVGGFPAGRTYAVCVTLGDGNTNVERRFGDLRAALDCADRTRDEVRAQNYTQFHVGVIDEDDPERGWLTDEDDR